MLYVVREKEAPDIDASYESLNERAIACAPLIGATDQADVRKLHQLINSFLQTETAEQRVKPLAKKQSGHVDMQALRNHCYSGEGNTICRIAVAEQTRDTLHYKAKGQCSSPLSLINFRRCLSSLKKKAKNCPNRQRFVCCLRRSRAPSTSRCYWGSLSQGGDGRCFIYRLCEPFIGTGI